MLGSYRRREYSMSYKVRYRGLEVVCDSLDEVDALADRQSHTPIGPVELNFTRNRSNGNSQVHTIKELVGLLKARPKKALKAVASNGGRMSDTDLARVMKAKHTMALAGIIAPLYKAARLNGIDEKKFFRREVHINEENGEQIKEYVIPSESLDEVKEGLRG